MEFSFVVENEDFFNWTGSVFTLRDTKHVLHQYVAETTEQHLATWHQNESQHITYFITHNLSGGDSTVQQPLYKLRCKCSNCTDIFKRLTAMKTFPNEPLQLGKPSSFSQNWWILLKMFLPKGSSNINSLEECDVALFLRLLERCQLFDEIEKVKLQKIITIRNKLMHSSSNEISTEQKKQYHSEMISLCENSSSNYWSGVSRTLKELSYGGNNLLRFHSPLQEFKEVRDAFVIQEKAIERDIEECKDIRECQFNSDELEKLLKQVRENEATATDVIDTKGKLVGTIKQATEIGRLEGEKLLPGYVGKYVGRMAAGAGANVAGYYKMSTDYLSGKK